MLFTRFVSRADIHTAEDWVLEQIGKIAPSPGDGHAFQPTDPEQMMLASGKPKPAADPRRAIRL